LASASGRGFLRKCNAQYVLIERNLRVLLTYPDSIDESHFARTISGKMHLD
jgi:hypothetical protein